MERGGEVERDTSFSQDHTRNTFKTHAQSEPVNPGNKSGSKFLPFGVFLCLLGEVGRKVRSRRREAVLFK